MARESTKSRAGGCIWVLVLLCFVLSDKVVNGRREKFTKKDVEVKKPRGTIKSFENEDGDVIDCVDIYKQPAFDHPLLKNHTIQMKPSFHPKKVTKENTQGEFFEGWIIRRADCPEGTVPIIRTHKLGNHTLPFISHRDENAAESLQYAQVGQLNGPYYGAHGYINVWNPKTGDGDYSAAQIWVESGPEMPNRNIIQAGWRTMAPDRKTRVTLGWTSDGYQKTGCYNLDCPGFVQTSWKFPVGAVVAFMSIYGGKQYEMRIGIQRDKISGNWWLQVGDVMLGYWPGKLFTGLSRSADYIYWGGEVGTDAYLSKTTEMGSGHFPNEGIRKAGFFRSISYVDKNGFLVDARDLTLHVLNPNLYDVLVPYPGMKYFGVYFLFGGPGHHF